MAPMLPGAATGMSMMVRGRQRRLLHASVPVARPRLQVLIDWLLFSPIEWNKGCAAKLLEQLENHPEWKPRHIAAHAQLAYKLFAILRA
jgi:hypothetical protein